MRRAPAPLLCLATACLFAACLVDQGIELEPDPIVPSQAPRIVGWEPEFATLYTQRACRRSFSLLGVEVPDPDAPVELRWFVNYEPGASNVLHAGIIPAGDGALRLVPSDLALSLSFDEFREEVLVVEAVVSDGFDPDPDRHPPNRAVLPGKNSAVATWTVIVSDEDWCDQ